MEYMRLLWLVEHKVQACNDQLRQLCWTDLRLARLCQLDPLSTPELDPEPVLPNLGYKCGTYKGGTLRIEIKRRQITCRAVIIRTSHGIIP